VLLGAERAHLAVRDLAARGTAAAIVLASGYTETGEAGARRQQQLLEAAGSMRLLGPNTIGLVNLTDHIVLMSVYAAILAAFLGLLWRDTPRERVRLGTRIFAALMVTGLAVAWAMYPG
jgi:acyl-CoA synthetase (NDP forming)